MNLTLNQSKDEIAKLCHYFEVNRKSFLASGVKEAHVRQSLIDPFFETLGWDVRNSSRIAPQYREVVPEDSLDVEGHQKAPDYTFRVGTLPKFYAEAKKCGINISADPGPAYQLRRYAFSAKLALSILTDFEELGVYECSSRPRPSDKSSHSRIQYFHFEEYPDKWREIWDIFSREAVWSGSFDQYITSKRKRGTSEVDNEFLKDIEQWRESLARNIALRNPQISVLDLNAAVQRTIDRIIFLRMAEDRGLEPYAQILKLCEQPDIYRRFISNLCRKADERYNSGLFHFQKEPGIVDVPDTITPRLIIDDKTLKPIIQSLYFEFGSPYHFGVLPVEILGTVYERFLGKVIRLTAGHQAKVEEKPEVRKAGGVYYTPSYIVDYIVKNTVGKQVEVKSPAQIAKGKDGQPIRILDMACGSGSFLLGAYQYLLDHCTKWYEANQPEKHTKAVFQDAKGTWRLTITERKRILTTHIFGVDIDHQAVEVTKLSLLLKALEGENDSSLTQQMKLFQERALPNLSNNIKCGNSLIGPDYFTGKLFPDPEELNRINPFDWKAEFSEVMKTGGFDCIIGNPPYIRIQTMKEWAPREVEIYKEKYLSAQSGNYDIYVVFIEQGLKLLNNVGQLGYICPHKFFNSKYGAPIRSIISIGSHLTHVVHFGDQQVFDGATTYTCLLFLRKALSSECQYVRVSDLDSWLAGGKAHFGTIDSKLITASEWTFAEAQDAVLIDKCTLMPDKLGDISKRMAQGIRTSANEVYVLDDVRVNGTEIIGHSKILNRDIHLESEAISPFLLGREIKPYRILSSRKAIIIPYRLQSGRAVLIPEKEIQQQLPLLYAYLCENKNFLSAREKGRMHGPNWYAYVYPKNIELMHNPKLLVPDIANCASFALDEFGNYAFTSGYAIVLREDIKESAEYILGLLNSSLLDFFLKRISTTMRGGFFRYFAQYIEQLPIRRIDFSNAIDRYDHDHIVRLVESMIASYKQLVTAESMPVKELLQYQISKTRAEIDQKVYALYGLTAEEIALVESRLVETNTIC